MPAARCLGELAQAAADISANFKDFDIESGTVSRAPDLLLGAHTERKPNLEQLHRQHPQPRVTFKVIGG